MALVEYGSDSDSEQAQQHQPKLLPGVQDEATADLDDGEDNFNPQDAFGIARISEGEKQATGEAGPAQTRPAAAGASKSSAPEVISAHLPTSNTLVTRPTDNVIYYNASYTDLTRPVQGPANPWNDGRLEKQNVLTGHVEQQHFSDFTFNEQQRSFHVLGYAANPSLATEGGYVGDVRKAFEQGGTLISDVRPSRSQVKATRRKRKAKGRLGEFDDPDSEEEQEEEEVDELGADGEVRQVKRKKEKLQREYLGPWAGWEGEKIEVVAPTEEEYEEQEAAGGPLLNKQERRKKLLEDAGRKEIGFGEEKSVFHGKETRDYLGRTYLHIPNDLDGVNLRGEPGAQESFAPKRCIHTWSGHTKGVSRIQLFPGSGHLILSGSLDTRIKLWDVYREGKCLRTFMGHSKAVHDVTFDNTGAQFMSAAFDRQMKLWDTETGASVSPSLSLTPGLRNARRQVNQSTFLAGMSNKKIVQYDIRSGEITQEYDRHLGPVNTITFVDENRRFITTSDDKKMCVWDFDIPVPIKLIQDPSMHSMPATGLSPDGKWLAATSLDNQVVIFAADTFKQNRKKHFGGYEVSGYACEPRFSPDGRFLSSGDGQGNMVFWDWKTGRIASRLHRAHKQVIISHAWLPHETSKVVTSSWDGLIKLWD
ncbi:pre-mRNA splicing factor [Rhodotorula toruloides]|uniref:Pre-mRNA-processing factor 17 n=1 Tax=Rhodotorula toruloides TaxID=5286 RepID=A0A511KLL1_RHOTO|nr:pre-mRNA splicing factor [Rhodotorula toruloides]